MNYFSVSNRLLRQICRKIAAATRRVFGRDSVEGGLSDALIEKNAELGDLFDVKWVKMKKKIAKVRFNHVNYYKNDEEKVQNNVQICRCISNNMRLLSNVKVYLYLFVFICILHIIFGIWI